MEQERAEAQRRRTLDFKRKSSRAFLPLSPNEPLLFPVLFAFSASLSRRVSSTYWLDANI